VLTLTRSVGEKLIIAPDIEITIIRVHRRQVKLGIIAPKQIKIYRSELCRVEATEGSQDEIAPTM